MGTKRKHEKRGRTQNGHGKSEKKSVRDSVVDEDYVHYASDDGAPNEKGTESGAGSKGVNDTVMDADSGDDDISDDDDAMEDEEAEIALAAAQEDESDVEVTLDFYDPRDKDVSAISSFLDPWVRRIGHGLNAEPLSKVVCAQTRVGTTVRVEDDDAPVGFISCLNVRRHNDLLSALRKRLLRECGDVKSGEEVKKVLDGCMKGEGRYENEKMGLILTERVVNMPPPVIPKLLEALFCEIEWAVEDEPTRELREDYRFGWYLYVTEAVTETVPNGSGDSGTKKKKQKTAGDKEGGEERIGFVKVEDEAWFKFAAHKIWWNPPADDQQETTRQAGKKVVALLIPTKQVPDVRKAVEQLVGAAQQTVPPEAPDEGEAMES